MHMVETCLAAYSLREGTSNASGPALNLPLVYCIASPCGCSHHAATPETVASPHNSMREVSHAPAALELRRGSSPRFDDPCLVADNPVFCPVPNRPAKPLNLESLAPLPIGDPDRPDPEDPIVLRLYNSLLLYDPLLCSLLLREWGLGPLLTPSLFSVKTPGVLVDALSSIETIEFPAVTLLNVRHIHLFSDGSFDDPVDYAIASDAIPHFTSPLQSVWSFSCLIELCFGTFQRIGHQARVVDCVPASSMWLGADSDDSEAAELSGIVWLLLWVLSKQYLWKPAPHIESVSVDFDSAPAPGSVFWAGAQRRHSPLQGRPWIGPDPLHLGSAGSAPCQGP